MLKTANASFMLGTSSWREQFIDALTVSAGDDDEEEEAEVVEVDEEAEPGEADGLKGGTIGIPTAQRQPSKSDYFMHFLSVPWKLLFATIPPTGKKAGN